ncbi:hypothetical protein TNCV_1823591 [Trichonephila clavipes]|nr:hypothetical protein TNCV_1823591 [Trichonephila clavipes]
MDHVILNHGQMTWTTLELALPPLTTTLHHWRTFQLSTDLTCIAALHGGLRWYWARTRENASHDPITLTTQLPRPPAAFSEIP